MDVTYSKLKGGYTLHEGDTLLLHGVKYCVAVMANVYWLHALDLPANSAVKDKLHMSTDEFFRLAKHHHTIYSSPYDVKTAFPEFSNLNDLTAFVIDLYEKSPIKVGDMVKVLPREYKDTDYPYCYSDIMLVYAGKTFKVTNIELSIVFEDAPLWNGDPHIIRLERTGGYSWHSSELELVLVSAEDKKSTDTIDDHHVTLEDLMKGYILQAKDKVYFPYMDRCFTVSIHNPPFLVDGHIIFQHLGVGCDIKIAWAQKYGFDSDGGFPFMASYEALTEFTKDLLLSSPGHLVNCPVLADKPSDVYIRDTPLKAKDFVTEEALETVEHKLKAAGLATECPLVPEPVKSINIHPAGKRTKTTIKL